MTYGDVLNKLSKSKFRNSFHLKEKDINYINEKGYKKIKEQRIDEYTYSHWRKHFEKVE